MSQYQLYQEMQLNVSIREDLLKIETENNHIQIMGYLSILLGCIIVLGVIANVTNIIVFSRKSMRKTSTFRFLFYLSIVDLLVLLISALEAFDRGIGNRLKLREISNFTCKTHTFLTYFITHTSSNLLMVISIDRALVISDKTLLGIFKSLNCLTKKYSKSHNPKKKQTKSTECCFSRVSIPNVDLVVISIIVIFFILNSHYLIFLDLNLVYTASDEINVQVSPRKKLNVSKIEYNEFRYECHPVSDTFYRNFLDQYWNWIGICSIVILLKIYKNSKKLFKTLSKTNRVDKENFYKRVKRNRQLLYMLLITNLYFLLTLLPCCIVFIYLNYKETTHDIFYIVRIQYSAHILSYSNYSVNIFFYIIWSQKYREEFFKLFGKTFNSHNGNNNVALNEINKNKCQNI